MPDRHETEGARRLWQAVLQAALDDALQDARKGQAGAWAWFSTKDARMVADLAGLDADGIRRVLPRLELPKVRAKRGTTGGRGEGGS